MVLVSPIVKHLAVYSPQEYPTINLGTGGNHPSICIFIKVFLTKINPKYAVMIFFANDNFSQNKSYYYDFILKTTKNILLIKKKLSWTQN